MITVDDLTMRFGARVLMSGVSFHVNNGDKIGLIGRNGTGKTTLASLLAGDEQPAHGTVTRTGTIGYLPQDPREGDLSTSARDRILSARGLDTAIARMRDAESRMGASGETAMQEYSRAEAEFVAGGGFAAEAEAAQLAASLGLPNRLLTQPLSTLSGGQRRRIELARILFSQADTLLLDEPTNHLDADSIAWLREFLRSYSGGLVIISHDEKLLDATVNKVVHVDGSRSTIDVYNMGWQAYQAQLEADERRRTRQRVNTERKAEQLTAQANKMRAKATKASAAQHMLKRAESMMADLDDEPIREKTAKIDFPTPAPCGKTPLVAQGLSKSYGSLEVFTDVDLAIDSGSRVVILGLNGAGKTTLLRLLAGLESPDTGKVLPGYGLSLGYYAQEHETLDTSQTVLENLRDAAPGVSQLQARNILGSFLFSGDDAFKPASVLSGGEKTRLALATVITSAANVLLLDEPTNNLDPASRNEVLTAIRDYTGALVLVTHDEGAVEALNPDRVVLLPDGDEDIWSEEYAELVDLA